jgi:CRP-like cAMP-binding protein
MPLDRSALQTNELLASLAPSALAVLKPHLERVELRLGQKLSIAGRVVRYAYFPISGMISLVQAYGDGSTIEVGLIGQEGFYGTSLVLGARSSPVEAMVQGQGAAWRVAAKALIDATDANTELRNQFLRYAHCLHVQVAVSGACNGTHRVPQRLARWLLEAQNRLREEDVPLSHEFISYMLGIRRAGVTSAMAVLKTRGLISTGRGSFRILRRKEMETEACECYRIVESEYRRVFALAVA